MDISVIDGDVGIRLTKISAVMQIVGGNCDLHIARSRLSTQLYND